MPPPGVRNRPALGQAARIGSLYDARSDSFLPVSLFKSSLPPKSVFVRKVDTSESKTSYPGTYGKKFNELNLDPELVVSFLSGLVHVDRSGSYLLDQPETDHIAWGSLHYNISTVREVLNLEYCDLEQHLNLDVLQGSLATHVVTEVGWGALTILVARYPFTDKRGELRGRNRVYDISEALDSIIRRGNVGYISWGGDDPKITIDVYTDIVVKDHTVFTNFNDACQFVSSIPQRIAGMNGGKGQPTAYSLLPLGNLPYSHIPKRPTIIPLSTSYITGFIQTFERLRDSHMKLNNYRSTLKRNESYVPSDHIEALTEFRTEALLLECELMSTCSQLLVSARSGESEPEMRKLLRDVDGSYQGFLSITGEYEEKVRFIGEVISRGGRYVQFDSKAWRGLDLANAYVLFYLNKTVRSDPKLWRANERLMLDLLDNVREGCQIVVCDCDFGPPERDLKITYYQGGGALVDDLLNYEMIPLALCDERYIQYGKPKPQHRRAVKIPCPGPNCASGGSFEWFCASCRTPIEFGDKDQYLYCDCGCGRYQDYSFKCKDMVHHGSSFERYEEGDLLRLLQSLETYEELNILILGETGVGKSTFINAFINYLTFGTLDDAIGCEDLQWITPCSFSAQYLDAAGLFCREDIKVGQSADEKDRSYGESATQSTTVYRMRMGDNKVLRLIDTPGIGDIRGIDQDKKNMDNILSTLANFERLHGILVLLKPKNTCPNLTFEFCTTELLTHLNRDAAANMVFGFTGTRVTNFTPGDSFRPLQSLLEKHRELQMDLTREKTYCFDSESFHFLAALKQTGRPIGEKGDFFRSWKRSKEESQRLLAHFRSLRPYLVKEASSLNRACDLITTLTKPMAEIMDVINTTIRINEDHLKELADERCKGDALKQHLHFQKVNRKTEPLEKPRTVCTEPACVEYVKGVSGSKPVYKTHCHNICYLTEVPRDAQGTQGLKPCAAFSNGVCSLCKHDWTSHQHVMYELADVVHTETNLEVEKKPRKHRSEIEAKEVAMTVFKEKIDECKQELKKLGDAAAQFGLFLKLNSITAYNDEMLDYLDKQIKEARQTVDATQTGKDRLDGLEHTRKEYEQRIRILEKEMQAGQSCKLLDERDIEVLVRGLYDMGGWGQNLNDLKTAIDYRSASYYEETPRAPGRRLGLVLPPARRSSLTGKKDQAYDQPPPYSPLISPTSDSPASRPRHPEPFREVEPFQEVEPGLFRHLGRRIFHPFKHHQ